MALLTGFREGRANGPLDSFMYALKSSESRRQNPRRLKLFLDFIELSGTLQQQAIEFLNRSKVDINLELDLIRFLNFHKERVRRNYGLNEDQIKDLERDLINTSATD